MKAPAKPSRLPRTAKKAAAAATVARKPRAAPAPPPVAATDRQAGDYVFQIGPVPVKPGSRLKGSK